MKLGLCLCAHLPCGKSLLVHIVFTSFLLLWFRNIFELLMAKILQTEERFPFQLKEEESFKKTKTLLRIKSILNKVNCCWISGQ